MVSWLRELNVVVMRGIRVGSVVICDGSRRCGDVCQKSVGDSLL